MELFVNMADAQDGRYDGQAFRCNFTDRRNHGHTVEIVTSKAISGKNCILKNVEITRFSDATIKIERFDVSSSQFLNIIILPTGKGQALATSEKSKRRLKTFEKMALPNGLIALMSVDIPSDWEFELYLKTEDKMKKFVFKRRYDLYFVVEIEDVHDAKKLFWLA